MFLPKILSIVWILNLWLIMEIFSLAVEILHGSIGFAQVLNLTTFFNWKYCCSVKFEKLVKKRCTCFCVHFSCLSDKLTFFKKDSFLTCSTSYSSESSEENFKSAVLYLMVIYLLFFIVFTFFKKYLQIKIFILFWE